MEAAVTVEGEEEPVVFPNFDEQSVRGFGEKSLSHHLNGFFVAR